MIARRTNSRSASDAEAGAARVDLAVFNLVMRGRSFRPVPVRATTSRPVENRNGVVPERAPRPGGGQWV
jgi:hypothetical protein